MMMIMIIMYTMMQNKGANFLLCAFFNTCQKLVIFFRYIKETISYNFVYLIFACVKNFA